MRGSVKIRESGHVGDVENTGDARDTDDVVGIPDIADIGDFRDAKAAGEVTNARHGNTQKT